VGEGGFYVYSVSGGFTKILSSAMLPIACSCKGRFFYAEGKYTLLYTPEYQPYMISVLNGAGEINIPTEYGGLMAMETLFDKVYLFL
jgi:hypothetical protein